MAQRPQRLVDFLEDFLDQHTDEEETIRVDITDQEVQDLGLFFIRGFCGYVLRLRRIEAANNQSLAEAEFAETTSDDEESGEKLEYVH